MATQQHVRPFLHGLDIQRMIDLPNLPPVMRCRRASHQDTEQVLPFDRRKPRVPIVSHARGVHDRHRLRFEVIVQRLGQAERVPFLDHVAMGDLAQRMNPSIGAPCGSNRMRTRLDTGQGLFDCPLHGRLILLPLPSGKRFPLVFNFQRVSGHVPLVQRSAGTGKGAKALVCAVPSTYLG